MAYIYSWIPLYKEIVAKLPEYRHRQLELISVLRTIGVNVNDDEDPMDHKIPLTEIDPFTFLYFLGKVKNDWNKVKILRSLAALWQIPVVVNDVCGIPSPNPQLLWLFPYQYERNQNEIDRLWHFFELVTAGNLTDEDFANWRSIHGVEKQKISECLFLLNPYEALCLNGKVKPYVQSFGISTDFENYTQLKAIYDRVKTVIPLTFPEISYQGFLSTTFSQRQPNYYRIGTKIGTHGDSVLPEMLESNTAAIGWNELGNLYDWLPKGKKPMVDKMWELFYEEDDKPKSTASRKVGELLNFVAAKPFDYVFAADGGHVLAIGQIATNHYVYLEEGSFYHRRPVKWLKTGINDLYLDEALLTSFCQYKYPHILQQIHQYFQQHLTLNQPNKTKTSMNKALNQILYGPPGTGKTFATIDEAIAILKEDSKDAVRETKKKIFVEFQKASRVFFTTFHQNMAYEDFIEGIKPLEPQDGDDFLQYEIQDGIFMRACTEASYNYIVRNYPSAERAELLDFNQLFDRLYEAVSLNPSYKLQTRTGSTVSVAVTAQGNFGIRHVDGERLYTVSRERLSRLYEVFKHPEQVSNIHESFRKVIGGSNATAYWSVLNAIVQQKHDSPAKAANDADEEELTLSYTDKRQIVRKHLEEMPMTKLDVDKSDPYVFIIDEINRGNVAQIFGELITLIEDDKRLGNTESLQTILPYSKKAFSVPPNLYLIGTMNTADRSVEALDTALRRRFSFVPKMPKPDLLETTADGINLPAMLGALNARLQVLKDTDHTIGHAWLWGVYDLNELQKVFANRILPLLREYFYNDDEKLGLVLGDAFFKPHTKSNPQVFAKFTGGNSLASQYQQIWQYELKATSDLTLADFQSLYSDAAPDDDDDE